MKSASRAGVEQAPDALLVLGDMSLSRLLGWVPRGDAGMSDDAWCPPGMAGPPGKRPRAGFTGRVGMPGPAPVVPVVPPGGAGYR
jgi:hypothetical protein